MTLPFNPDELSMERGLVLAGYVEAGAPATLHPLYIRPERWPERKRLVLAANGRSVESYQSLRQSKKFENL